MAEETGNSLEASSASLGYFGDSFSVAPHLLQEVTTMDHNAPYSNSLVLNSPSGCSAKGRSVKEFEEQISALKKENFNLKLRIYFLEERMGTNFNMNTEEVVKKNVEIMVEVEILKKELNEKHELLCEAVKAMELEDEEHKRVLREKEILISQCLQDIELLKTQIVQHGDGVDVSVQSLASSKDPRCDLLMQELERTRSKLECYDRDLRTVRRTLEETQAKYHCLLNKADETNRMMESVMLENGELHMTCASLKTELERECKRHDRLKIGSDQKIGELQVKLEAALVSQPAAPARPAQKDAVVFPAAAAAGRQALTAAAAALMAASSSSPSSPTSPLPPLVDLASLGGSEGAVEQLRAERDLHQQKIVNLKSELLKACNIIKCMIQSEKKAKEEIADMKKRNEEMAANLQDAIKKLGKSSIDNNNKNSSALEEELDDYKLLTNELDEKNKILTETLTETRIQLDAIKQKHSDLVEKLRNKITDLEFEVISAQQQANFDDKLKEKDAEIFALNKKLERLTCDLQLLVNTELWSKNREIEKLQKAQALVSVENKEDVLKLHNELSLKESQLKLLTDKIADLDLDLSTESPVKTSVKLQLEKSEKLRFEAVKVCAILSGRLEELALFLDSLLKQKSVLGFLNHGENIKIRKVIDESLDLSKGFSLGGITDESLREFLNLNDSTKCDLSLGDLSLTYRSHLRVEEDSQIIDALRRQIVNLQGELQVRDVELNKLNLGDKSVNLRNVEALSESEDWSEPDRSVSKARIGLDDSLVKKSRGSSDSGDLRKFPKKTDAKLALQRQVDDLTDRVKLAHGEISVLKRQLDEAESKVLEAENERKEFESKVGELETIRKNLLNNLSTKDKELQNRLNELEVDRQQGANAAKKAEESAEKTERDLKSHQHQMELLSREIAVVRETYECEIRQAEGEIESLQNIVKDLHYEIAENYLLKSEVIESLTQNERLKESVSDYKCDLDSALDRENILKDKVTDLQNCIDGLRGDLDGATLQYSEAVLEKTKITNEKIFMEQERSRLLSKENELKIALENVQKEIVELRVNYASEKSLMEMQQSRLYIQISELESTNAELHNKLVRIQAGCINKSLENRSRLDLEDADANNRRLVDFERQETNSSPDLGIESDQGRFSSLENHISRPFLQTLELTESMNNLLDVETCQNQYPECCENELCCQKSLKVLEENTDLRRRLLKTRKALEETVTQLTLANQRKKQVEKTICKQIHKTSQVLRKAKANLDSGSETEAYKK